MNFKIEQYYWFLFLAIGIVYLFGLQVNIMDIDAAQYASLALEMADTNGFLQIKLRGTNYLDKPPLLFWLSALSFKLFGAASWSYKLPSFLFACLGIFSTYKFSSLFYSKQSSILSALILASCQAFFLITNDVRTDTILCCSIIFASWNLAAYIKSGGLNHFLFAFIGIGLALLSKGPIGLFTIIFAFGPALLLSKNFKAIFKAEWIIGLFIIGLLLLPMSIGLYQQYGVSGLRFYFWTQSFGRITGESTWANDIDPFFLFHSFLWSFIPWSILFLVGFVYKFKLLIIQKFKIIEGQEYYTVFGILLSYLALSRSAYQLPHYIYVILPYSAVITGSYIVEVLWVNYSSIYYKWIHYIQLFLLIVLGIIVGLLSFIVFEATILIWILFPILFFATAYIYFKSVKPEKIIFTSLVTIISVNFFMSFHVYPNLLKFQSYSEIGKYIKSKAIKESDIYYFKEHGYSLDFYAGFRINELFTLKTELSNSSKKFHYLFTNQEGLDSLKSYQITYSIIKECDDYHITTLKFDFLNPSTRTSTLKKIYLVKFY